MNKIRMLVLGVFLALACVGVAQQGVDPCMLVGKDTRTGVATEVWRGKPLDIAGQRIEISSKVSLNVLAVTSNRSQSFGSTFALNDTTLYTGLGIGYDVYSQERWRVKALVGYTANFSDPLNRIRTGDWGAGVAIGYRF